MQIVKIFKIFQSQVKKLVFLSVIVFVLPLFVLLRQYHYIITIIIVNGEKIVVMKKELKN